MRLGNPQETHVKNELPEPSSFRAIFYRKFLLNPGNSHLIFSVYSANLHLKMENVHIVC